MPRKKIVTPSAEPDQGSAARVSGAREEPGGHHAATKAIRRRVKDSIASLFDAFLERATNEEAYFFEEVLVAWQTEYSFRSKTEVGIACAFEACIECRHEYLRVPKDTDGMTKATLRAFLAGRLKELPAPEPTLPSRIRKGCSEEELAYCIRLIRLLRDNYWAAELVRQLLDREARSKYQWTIEKVKKLLEDFDGIEALARNAQRLGNNWSNHPILRAIRQEFGEDEIAAYKGERWVRDAIESAHAPE